MVYDKRAAGRSAGDITLLHRFHSRRFPESYIRLLIACVNYVVCDEQVQWRYKCGRGKATGSG
jgi:hypothetical protein